MAKYLNLQGLQTFWNKIKGIISGLDTRITNLSTTVGEHTTAIANKASTNHAHGSITNGGAITDTAVALASGDSLAFVDSSDSSKIKKTSITFDGSTTTQALTKAGTWATFNNYSHPTGSAPSKTGVPTANASPGFGGTFKVNQITTDSTSHVSSVTERTITIPNTMATTSAAGLMSAADKTKLDNATTKKTGFAYRGTSGGPVYKIAEKTFTSKTTTHSEQLIFDVSYSTHPTAIATSRLVVSFRVDANTSATMGFVTNTVIRKEGFTELPYKFYGAVDYANGKFTLYAKYISGAYVTVEAECILASSENTDLIDNVSVFKTTTAELPDTAKEETTRWVANTSASSGNAPVKVDAYGTLTAVPMDSTPTASSTNLMTSGAIKTALDGKSDIYKWNAVTQGQKWSRIFYSESTAGVVGSSGILWIGCTRASVVCNAVFLVTAAHNGAERSNIVELSSCGYSELRCRLVVNSSANYYFEVYDTANSIASGTTQQWYCRYIPLRESKITTYTAFTDGTTIPSNYATCNDFTITVGNSAFAIKNITRSGTTFTATRQNGSTFTFTQQDSDSKVTQTADDTSTGTGFELLFSATGDNTTRTEASRKSSKLTYQPSTGTLKSTAYNVNSKCTLQFNTTTNALDFVFA